MRIVLIIKFYFGTIISLVSDLSDEKYLSTAFAAIWFSLIAFRWSHSSDTFDRSSCLKRYFAISCTCSSSYLLAIAYHGWPSQALSVSFSSFVSFIVYSYIVGVAVLCWFAIIFRAIAEPWLSVCGGCWVSWIDFIRFASIYISSAESRALVCGSSWYIWI